MKAFLFQIRGNWAHFKKPETNNNPLTYDFITKTALIGLIGAVLGKDRSEMKELFPKLSEELVYGVIVQSRIKKESWGFTFRTDLKNLLEKSPKTLECLHNPCFDVCLALENENSQDIFASFKESIKNASAYYTPTLGLQNCAAELRFLSEGFLSNEKEGEFKTKAFFKKSDSVDYSKSFRLYLNKIPTYQNNDFWNPPEKFMEVMYPSEGDSVTIKNGKYYEFSTDKSAWVMI